MSGTRDDKKITESGEALDDKGLLYGISDDEAQAEQDTRPGSAVGGHEEGREPSEERDEMDEERRG